MSAKCHTDCSVCPVRARGPLKAVPQAQLEALNREKTVRVYRPGQIIFYEDNKPFGLYCVEQGKVKLTRSTPEGKSYISRIAGPGDLLGYRAFVTHERYAATAEVLETATLCFLDSESFEQTLSASPALAMQLLEQLGSDLKTAENQARDLAYKSVTERLVDLLLSMKDKYGRELPDGDILLDINLSREEIASMLGATVETTVRALSRFRAQKLIGQKQKKMLLKDLPRLAQYIAC